MRHTNIEHVLSQFRQDPRFISSVTTWQSFDEQPGSYDKVPSDLHPSLRKSLNNQGVVSLYSHQKRAYDLVSSGKNICVITPTASGKTLCYNLPVLNSILKNSNSKSMYIFPTKALAQDQKNQINQICSLGNFSIKTFTCDGDTPNKQRELAKHSGQIIITNPDMLHHVILPQHRNWHKLLRSLTYIVVDEIHNYRGVFGSHVANVFRRLKRICKFYDSQPQYVLASATIANPNELAFKLIEEEVSVIKKSGAPTAAKDFIFCNSRAFCPGDTSELSVIDAASRIANKLISNDIQTLIFAKSRKHCELLIQQLRNYRSGKKQKDKIRGYRGGYLPNQRRMIEKKIRQGDIMGIAATNALELGIDIGGLNAIIMAGYPGTIADTWQQAGRAGRRQSKSVAILISGNSPLDQFIINNPDYFFKQAPEYALLDPDNPQIVKQHLRCANFELPGSTRFAKNISKHSNDTDLMCSRCTSFDFTATVSLRSRDNSHFSVIDITNDSKVIGTVDQMSAPMLIHNNAIYLHEGQQYLVLKLDHQTRKAYVKRTSVNYYTDARVITGIKIITVDNSYSSSSIRPELGKLRVTKIATIYKKYKLHTYERIGYGEITIPKTNLDTRGIWFSLPDDVVEQIDPHLIGKILSAISNLVACVAPLYLLNHETDLGVTSEVRSPYNGKPTIYLYDRHPGGIGFADKLFSILSHVFRACFDLISSCQCLRGCPLCVGPENQVGDIKNLSTKILKTILASLLYHKS